MRRFFYLPLLAFFTGLPSYSYKTPGNGSAYSFARLSETAGSGVEKAVYDGTAYYILTANDTISEGDTFVLDSDVSVLFADDVKFVIEGEADLRSTSATFDSEFTDGAQGVGIYVENRKGVTPVENCTFNTVGLRNLSAYGMDLRTCTFSNNNGKIGQAALVMGADGASFTIRDCIFKENAKAAIAGAANYRNPLLVEGCHFIRNGQANSNTPQLNLTVAEQVVIRDCDIEGDPEKTMVGGIVVANLVGFDGDLHTVIENNDISHCRFGIATYLWQEAVIKGNILVDNCHETNPMNGGSGINVYDPYYKQLTRIEGNHIEGSLWGVTLVGGKEANLGRTDVAEDDARYNPGGNVFVNNGNGGQLYDLYNNSTNTVYAQGNTWNVSEQTKEQIETVVFHKADNAALGEVVFMPAASQTAVATPHTEYSRTGMASYSLSGQRIPDTRQHRSILYISGGKKTYGKKVMIKK